jgi:hypothetical protein
MMGFSVANLVQFYSHNRFVPNNVSTPVLLLALVGLAACLVATLGWCGAMRGNICRLYTVREAILQQKLKHIFTYVARSSKNSLHKIYIQ